MKNSIYKTLMVAGIAVTTLACNDSDRQDSPTISHGQSLTSSGAPDIQREKKLSELNQAERTEFMRAVEVRIKDVMVDDRVLNNMCSMSGAMAGIGYGISGQSASEVQNMCETVTSECRQGVARIPTGVLAIEPDAESFACDVPVDSMLGCLEESAKVMEAFRDAAGDISCSSPKSSLERFLRTLQRLAPNGKSCETLQRECPGFRTDSEETNASMPYDDDWDAQLDHLDMSHPNGPHSSDDLEDDVSDGDDVETEGIDVDLNGDIGDEDEADFEGEEDDGDDFDDYGSSDDGDDFGSDESDEDEDDFDF